MHKTRPIENFTATCRWRYPRLSDMDRSPGLCKRHSMQCDMGTWVCKFGFCTWESPISHGKSSLPTSCSRFLQAWGPWHSWLHSLKELCWKVLFFFLCYPIWIKAFLVRQMVTLLPRKAWGNEVWQAVSQALWKWFYCVKEKMPSIANKRIAYNSFVKNKCKNFLRHAQIVPWDYFLFLSRGYVIIIYRPELSSIRLPAHFFAWSI